MRILLVEDSTQLSDALTSVLKREKYEVENAYNGEDGLEMALSNIFDLIILDVLMPKMDGFEVLSRLRMQKISTPIILLTALTEEANKVKGLDLGADDYLSKPFSIPELLARVRALTRRKGEMLSNNSMEYQEVYLDLAAYTIKCRDKSINLSQKEFEIMRYLLQKPQMIAEKEQLIAKVWGFHNDFEYNNLEVYISFLRKKLKYIGAPWTISSVRGIGYQIKSEQK